MKHEVRQVFRRLGYNIEGVRYTPRQLLEPQLLRALEFDDVICRRMHEHGRDLGFIQVGAYDGVSTDPLRKYVADCGWRGVMLEPQPRPAAALRQLYSENDAVVVIEAAVDAGRRMRTLYTVECDSLPKWAGGMASFNRDHIARHDCLLPGVTDKIRELTVSCVTFDDVLAAMPTERVDLLQIDAEGADGFLLSLFPWKRTKPAIVHWEIKNLTRAAQETALDLVCGHGYRIARSGAEDMLAVLPEAAD